MSTHALTIREPQIALVTSGQLTTLWRVGATVAGMHPGDRIWVREPFYLPKRYAGKAPTQAHQEGAQPIFAADLDLTGPDARDWLTGRRVAYTMPRVWHRQHLVVQAIERRRLHTITAAEARAQGYRHLNHFIRAWDCNVALAGHAARWAANPIATLIHFDRIGEPLP